MAETFPIYISNTYTAPDCDALHAFQSRLIDDPANPGQKKSEVYGNMNVLVGQELERLYKAGYKPKPTSVKAKIDNRTVEWTVRIEQSTDGKSWLGFTSRGSGCGGGSFVELISRAKSKQDKKDPASIKQSIQKNVLPTETSFELEEVDTIAYVLLEPDPRAKDAFAQIFYTYTRPEYEKQNPVTVTPPSSPPPPPPVPEAPILTGFQIRGKVVDENGDPLQGATVSLLNATTNTQLPYVTTANANGDYTIKYNPTADITEFNVQATTVSRKSATASIKIVTNTFITEGYNVATLSLLPDATSAGDTEIVITVPRRKPTPPPPPPPLPPPPPTKPSTAKGFESIIVRIAKFIAKVDIGIDKVFFGDGRRRKGIYRTIVAINQVDFCNIINWALTQATTDLIKNPKLKGTLEKVFFIAETVDEKITNYLSFSTITNRPRTPEGVQSSAQSNSEQRLTREKLNKLVQELKSDKDFQELQSILTTIGPAVSTIPGLAKLRSFYESIALLLQNFRTAEDIPNEDIQKIVEKLRDFQNILRAVASIKNAQGVANLLGLQDEIDKLQEVINPARILPTLKEMLTAIKSIIQVGLKILKYITLVRTIVLVIIGAIKVFRIIRLIFKFLFVPLMGLTYSVTSLFDDIKSAAKDGESKFIKTLRQINQLLDVIYDFVSNLLEKTIIIEQQLRILYINLLACEQLKDDPIVEEVNITLQDLIRTNEQLRAFVDSYQATRNDTRNSIRAGSYTIRIIEEEVVDEGRTLRRRRAAAFDQRGILILEGDLSFATNNAVLIEELRLKLESQNLVEGSSLTLDLEQSILLSDIGGILNIPDIDSEFDAKEGAEDTAEIQAEISQFIEGLPGGLRLKKKVQKKVQESVAQRKQELASGGSNPITNNLSSSTTGALGKLDTSPATPQPLTPEQIKEYTATIKLAVRVPTPSNVAKAVKAREALRKDSNYRAKLKAG